MGNINKPVLMQEDYDLFERIAKHGFVDMEYVYRFAYPGRKKRTIDSRVLQLERHKYLCTIRTFIPAGYTISYRVGYRIITLGINALEILANMGIMATDRSETIKTASPYRMHHQAQVATVCDTLRNEYNKSLESKWEVIEVLNEKEAYLEDYLNRPDAVLIFKRKGMENYPVLIVFIEIERSYASTKSLSRKIRGYDIITKKKLYDQEMNLHTAEQRILFVTQSMLQRDALLAKLSMQETQLHILVSGYQDVVKRPLDNVYVVPSESQSTCRLLSKYPSILNKSIKETKEEKENGKD